MEAKHVPTGFKILIGMVIYILTFLLARPSTPATEGQREFWSNAARLFGERDIEGFVGITLLFGCALVTIVGYKVVIRLIEVRLNRVK